MFVYITIFLLFVSSTDTAETRSGYLEEYVNKNYTPMISQTRYMTNTKVDSKLSCHFTCLDEDDCSMIVFNQTNYQCILYNIFPVVDQELLHADNIVVSIFERTIQLPTSISNTTWLTSRLNTTIPTKIIPVQYPRCLVIDTFGYLLTLETINITTYINRYDRTNLQLIQQVALQMQYNSISMLSYYNEMIFISPYYNNISIFDHVNFSLLGIINCGSSLNQPRDIIFIENQKMLIIISLSTNTLVFVRFNSPTNYTCLNSTHLPSGASPQALMKINETFFYVTTWSSKCVYSYSFNGLTWIQSLFANVSQTLAISSIHLGHLHVDSLGRRWIMVVGFGLVIYDEWGTFLSSWKFGNASFDIYISDDYRIIVSDYGISSLTLYEPNITL